MIKKSIFLLSVLASVVGVQAQDEFDALKVSQTQLKGTARYVSMGGAFTALGGDASAISLNPAGLGVYRSSELTGSLNMLNSSTSSNWNGVTNSDNNIFAHFNNVGIVLSIPGTDAFSSAISFTFDRLKSFNRSGVINGNSQLSSLTDNIAARTNGISENDILANDAYSNVNIPWISILGYDGGLITPNTSSSSSNQWSSLLGAGETVMPGYNFTERGYVDQYSLSYGTNLSNIVYLGASVGWQSISYSLTSNYSEQFAAGGGMNLQNQIYTTGSGFDVKLGVIVRPTDFLRLGFSYHTPVFYTMTDSYYAALAYDGGIAYTPSEGGYSRYRLQTPSTYNFGIATTIGKRAILSFDYQYEDFSTLKYSDTDGNSSAFQFENEGAKLNLQGVSTFKVGCEIRATDNISVRLGYNYITPATKDDAYRELTSNSIRTDNEYFLDVKTQNFAVGIGYRYNSWNFDLAYVLNDQQQKFYAYDDASLTPAKLTTNNSNLIFTIGFRY